MWTLWPAAASTTAAIRTSRHDGIHTFHVGKNSHVHYTEKHYGEGDGTGEKIFNPQTIVYLEEGASIQMDTTQIRGVDSTKRYTKIVCGKDAEAVVTERLLTHGSQLAESDMEIVLDGEDSKGRVISRSVAQDQSSQVFYPRMVGNAKPASAMSSATPSSWETPRSAPSRRSPPTAPRPS